VTLAIKQGERDMPRLRLDLSALKLSPAQSRRSPSSPSGNIAPAAAMSPVGAPSQDTNPRFPGTSSPISTGAGAEQQLLAQAPKIAEELKTLTPVEIEPAIAPLLADLSEVTCQLPHHNVSNLGNDYFINVTAKADPGHAKFSGHKVHLSVSQQHFELAYSAMGSLLFSTEAPIIHFKLTDMFRARDLSPSSAATRVTHGAQFTLYLHTSRTSGHYDAQLINAISSFVEQCEKAMIKAEVLPGLIPLSDVPLGAYASYRNEEYDRTAATKAMENEKICELLKLAIEAHKSA
jgi:hypothetical protein